MDTSWVVLCLMGGMVMGSISGQTVPCMETREDCQRTGFSSISVYNNRYRCCAPGYSMSFVNGLCSCTQFAEVMPCSEGPCMSGGSSSIDYRGHTRCCPPGFGMNSQSSAINGLVSSSCTCTRAFWNSGSSSIFIGNGMMPGTGDTVNATALAQSLAVWRQQFQQNMANSMQHLTGQLQAMTSQMANQMYRMKTQMASTFGRLANMFQGW